MCPESYTKQQQSKYTKQQLVENKKAQAEQCKLLNKPGVKSFS